MIVNALVSTAGQIVQDERSLPASAHTVTGVGAFAQPREYLQPAPPVFFHGAMAQVPGSASLLTPGVLTLAANGQPARAEFTQSAGPGEYLLYAVGVQLPAAQFAYMGFIGGFLPAGSLYALVNGVSTPFRLYRSVTPNLGVDVQLTVTHL